MRVLVAGASGAIGRPLVAQLVAASHTVVGMTRSDRGVQALRAWEPNLWWLMFWMPPPSSTRSASLGRKSSSNN
jgi:nucleoside-diphosphate-sugar epimerase